LVSYLQFNRHPGSCRYMVEDRLRASHPENPGPGLSPSPIFFQILPRRRIRLHSARPFADNLAMTKPLLNLVSIFILIGLGPLAQAAEPKAPPSYQRQVGVEKGQWIYTVDARAPHLFMISRDLYGTDKNWKQIADWNNLKPPYALNQGQRLVLKKVPSQSTEQGNATLIAAWTKQKRWDVVGGIKATEVSEAPATTAAAEVQVSPAAPVAPAAAEPEPEEKAEAVAAAPEPPPAPMPTPKLPAPEHAEASLAAAPPVATPAPPAPAPTPAKAAKLEHKEENKTETSHEHGSSWEFAASAVASKFRMDSKYEVSGMHYILNSDMDYGLEVEVGYHFSESTHLFLSAGAEKMDVHKPDDLELEKESQYVWRYALGLEKELLPRLALMASVIYEQIPFIKEIPTGGEIRALAIPEISLGGRVTIWEQGRFTTDLSLEGLYLFAKDQDDIHVNTGQGIVVGLKFQNKFASSALNYGLGYRHLSEDTNEATHRLDIYFGNIGMSF
jgi:hypothetical protein